MSETCGGVGVCCNPGFKPGIKNPLDFLRDAQEQRRIIQEEMRKRKLEEKGENGELNTREALELSAYKIEERLEKLALLKPHTICYNA